MGDEKDSWKVKTLDEILQEKKRRKEQEEKAEIKRLKNSDERDSKRDSLEEGELRDHRMEITIRNSPYRREDSTEDRGEEDDSLAIKPPQQMSRKEKAHHRKDEKRKEKRKHARVKEKEREHERRKRHREEQDKARREWERQKRREMAREHSRRERGKKKGTGIILRIRRSAATSSHAGDLTSDVSKPWYVSQLLGSKGQTQLSLALRLLTLSLEQLYTGLNPHDVSKKSLEVQDLVRWI